VKFTYFAVKMKEENVHKSGLGWSGGGVVGVVATELLSHSIEEKKEN
jgi:phosphomevalonate kinase